ncbi:alpha/beta hydrolase [Halorarius halobius]|uniref:alpha/beta hydrolase n=1 Tax=Halorarius halobius TaxID=2962671 RepID=UPI0020CE2D0B|nr:dienelactone hydrolase family protein [Halorarius halobius]
MTDPDLHAGEPATAGARLEAANAAVILVHGRGATARSILAMHEEFGRDDVAYLAPPATGNEWYPQSFLAPVEQNEPGRTAGLDAIDRLVERAGEAGIDPERVLVLGFSQGGCLATEYAATRPRRYGGVVALSGGLIGDELDGYDGDLSGTPVFLGCSDVDPHIPLERVHETRDVFESLGADVEERIYEGMGHGVNRDEIEYVAGMVAEL